MALTPWQDYVSKRFPGENNAPNPEQLGQLAQEFFGNIPLPPGVQESQVVNRTGSYVDYKDEQGYVHRLIRELDGRSPLVGQISQGPTSRPASVPIPGEQQAATDLLARLKDLYDPNSAARQANMGYWQDVLKQFTGQLGQAPALASIDPATQAALAAINANEQAQLKQQFNDQQGDLVAQLFGTGTNRSSMAGQQAARMLQEQGLVSAQQLAQGAQRELAVRQFLAQLGQGNLALGSQNALGAMNTGIQETNSLAGLVSDLFKNSVNRDAINAQADLNNRQLAEQQRQYNTNTQNSYVQFQEQMRALERQNTWNNIFRGISTAASIATGIPGLFGAANPGAQGANTGFPSGAGPTTYTPQFGAYGTPPLTGFQPYQ